MPDRIACLPGDGIGPEVMAEAVQVLRALPLELELTEHDFGGIVQAARNIVGHTKTRTHIAAYARIPLAPWFSAHPDLFEVDRTEREPGDVTGDYVNGWVAINETMQKLQNDLAFFEPVASFSKSRVMTVGELIDQGVLDMRMGRPKDRYDDAPEELQERMATASDVRDGTLRELGIDTEYDDYPELTREGDVLVTTMNTIRAH